MVQSSVQYLERVAPSLTAPWSLAWATGAKHYRDLVYIDRIEFFDSKGSGNCYREPAENAEDETTVTDQDAPF